MRSIDDKNTLRTFQDRMLSGMVERQKFNSLLKELFRKSIHICSAFVPYFLSLFYRQVIILLCIVLIVYSISEIFRLKGYTIPLVSKITETAARKRDANKFVLGPVTLVCGILLASLLLPLDCARVGIFALSFGDGFASLTGRFLGKVSIPFSGGKTAAGSLSCFFAVYISTFICSGNTLVSLIVAFAAMIIELLPIKDFDNLVIPISIGALFMFLR